MAYFLRKTRRKNGDIYYQIYDSYYSAEERKNKNRSVEKLGLLSSLRREGESDSECVQRLRGMVSERERDRSGKQTKQIDDNDELVN